eukprot:gene37269-45248_t
MLRVVSSSFAYSTLSKNRNSIALQHRALSLRSARRYVYTKKDRLEVWFEDFSSIIKRRKLMLKAAMVQRKSLEFQLPVLLTRLKVAFPYSLSDLAGHGSFVFLALSYLESDFLHLRMYAVSGITLSIIFQYYREKPLWIPIRWNTLFLLINGIMIGLLVRDDIAANNISPEQRALYHAVFERKGMSKVDFLRLMRCAQRLEVGVDHKLVDEHKTNTRVYLVQRGSIAVRRGGAEVGHIHENQFVGAMSFLTWDSNREEEDVSHRKASEKSGGFFFGGSAQDAAADPSAAQREAPATATATAMAANVEEPDISQAPHSAQEHHAAAQQPPHHQHQHHHLHLEQWLGGLAGYLDPAHLWRFLQPAAAPSAGESASPAAAAHGGVPSYTSVMFNPTEQPEDRAKAAAAPAPEDDASEGHHGHADVVSLTPCVAYYWRFKDLRALKEAHPSLGYVLERCISDDLNKKMFSTWEAEAKERYRQLLRGALCQGEVSEQVRGLLQQFRLAQRISPQQHELLLAQEGWTSQEYVAGFKGVQDTQVLRQYVRMVRDECRTGLSDEGRERLRSFRQQHRLSSAVHMFALREIDWTLDDYELGARQMVCDE